MTRTLNSRITLPLRELSKTINVIYYVIYAMVNGTVGPNTFTIPFFVICLILIPLQCIAEEYLLRGFIMQTLGSWLKIPVLALILQAAAFSLTHPYNIFGVLGVFIDGLVLGFFAWKTHGLETGSAFHSVNNFVMTMFVALGFDTSTSTITVTNFATTVALTLFTVFVLYYIGNKQGWFSEKTGECKLL